MKPSVNMGDIPNLTLWKAYREKKDSISLELLVKRYMHLVSQVANRLSMSIPQRSISRDDLIGMGSIGLLEAIQHFDYTLGYQFETYGLWRIKGAMLDGIRQLDWIPRSFRDRAKKLNQSFAELEHKLLRTPTVEELSQHMGWPVEEVEYILTTQSLTTLLSLQEPTNSGEEDGKTQVLLDQIPDMDTLNHSRQLEADEFKQLLARCIDALPEKEKLVISLFYYEELTQVEIAEVMGLSKGRISQLHSTAIAHLRRAFEARGLTFDLFR
ncbi:MAG TPA: FliA/WhiG family RNA polymerase sigma factor [Bacillota bacterium]|nr:FliA/WhiG family RNA polymerase sigma factor [Bacillota bacterium]